MEISLSKLNWQVKGYWPFVPIKEKSMETGQQLHGVTPWIPARVPGGVHYDLYQAGLIPNPYTGLDSLQCEWVENRWWMYRVNFLNPTPNQIRKTELVFEGLDYEALIYVNDCLLAEHKGMYEPLHVDITKVLKNDNKLVVIFKGIPQEMGQIGYTSRTSTQKSRFNYKWDFSTRLVNIGFWQDVKLKVWEETELKEIYIRTDYKNELGYVSIKGIAEKTEVKPEFILLELLAPETQECINAHIISINGDESFEDTITVEKPFLWYPNSLGSQPLYTIRLYAVTQTGRKLIYSQKLGIRSLTYDYNEKEPAGALPYTFIINGERTYIKGMNITPIDHIYGNVTKEQYEYLVDCAANANVNMLRIWGGGLIEKEWLYELCDEKGILIWQEFIQSSSGIDNIPSTDSKFLELLKRNSIAAIKQKRNHTALSVWSGGNELMEAADRPCGYDNANIAMLKELVEEHDPARMFLPTSASGPREFISLEKGVSHDVHGNWRYEGNPGHYELYGSSDNLFHSEFGVDGTSSLKSLKKFLPKEAWYPTPMSGNLYWQHHGEWWGTYYRDTEMFGPIDDLGTFVHCSQYMQAEGLRFIVEADRRRKYENSGCIIWQLNEPWPNASCTNLVDYFGEAKPAYYQVKKAYAPIHVSMTYQKLDYVRGEQFSQHITVHNSNKEFKGLLVCKVRNLDGCVVYQKEFQKSFASNSSNSAAKIEFRIEAVSEIFFIELKLFHSDQLLSENTYMFALKKEHLFEPLMHGTADVSYKVTATETDAVKGEIMKTVRIRNTGTEAAVHAGVELVEDGFYMIAQDNYVTLFPNEEKILHLGIRRKKTGGFFKEENLPENELISPNLKAVWFGCDRPKEDIRC